jgi:ABC-type transport system involved in multi-copper enzyme maturation permease subunit
VLLLFAAVLLASTLLLGALGGEQKNRMILDLGLVSIETFTLLVTVFASVTLVSEEMETRTLYLILARPVARYQFVLGRFFGLITLLAATYLLMALGHLTVLYFERIPPDRSYFLSLWFSWEKIVLITAIAMAFSLFATSTVSAVSFTFFFWILGHFSSELRFLAHKAVPAVRLFGNLFYYVTPNFQIMNLRDITPSAGAGSGWLWPIFGYGLSYTMATLAIVILLFRKKEF